MDYLQVILFLAFFLFTTTLVAFYLLYRFIDVMETFLQKTTPLLNIPEGIEPEESKDSVRDSYTPNYADTTVPLESFTPKKGLKIKHIEEEVDPDQVTPL